MLPSLYLKRNKNEITHVISPGKRKISVRRGTVNEATSIGANQSDGWQRISKTGSNRRRKLKRHRHDKRV